MIDSAPLPGTTSAAELIRDALERENDVVELEDPELRAATSQLNELEAPLPDDLRALRDAIGRALEIPTS